MFLDEHIKTRVIEYLAKKYPLTETNQSNKKL